MNKKLNILLMCLTDPGKTPRPKRIIEFLHSYEHTVDICAPKTNINIQHRYYFLLNTPSNNILAKILRKLCRALPIFYKNKKFLEAINNALWGTGRFKKAISEQKYDIIFVEDIHLLPFALKINKNSSIILDAREYYPDEISGNLIWKICEQPYRQYICNNFLKHCDYVLTVSEGLQRLYNDRHNIKTILFRSVPSYHNILPNLTENTPMRMVHHGLANPDRCLENMIDVFSNLDKNFTLDFYLTGNQKYIGYLKERAKQYKNIQFLDPVPFSEIIPMLSQYNIGFYLLEPTGLNTKYSLPNKIFEFIQARLCLVIGPSNDMASIVKKYKCGFISNSFDPKDMANVLNNLTVENITKAKEASHEAAHILCFEQESKKIIDIFEKIMAS